MVIWSFSQLPAEVRNSIYENLFNGALIEDYGLSPQPIRTKNYHLAITRTNRQIRKESLSVLHLATTFHFRIGQAGATPVPDHVLKEIRTVRLPAHRLRTLDISPFVRLETLVLDVSIDPAVWRLYAVSRNSSKENFSNVADMVNLGMTLGVFENSWDLDKIWRDEDRKFRILCWFSSWVREDQERQPILVDIDSGDVLQEPDLFTIESWSRSRHLLFDFIKSSASSIRKMPVTTFLSIPLEIRELIFDYILGNVRLIQYRMVSSPQRQLRSSRKKRCLQSTGAAFVKIPSKGTPIPILQANRQIREEVFDFVFLHGTLNMTPYFSQDQFPEILKSKVQRAVCRDIDSLCPFPRMEAFHALKVLTCHLILSHRHVRFRGMKVPVRCTTEDEALNAVLHAMSPASHFQFRDPVSFMNVFKKVFADHHLHFEVHVIIQFYLYQTRIYPGVRSDVELHVNRETILQFENDHYNLP